MDCIKHIPTLAKIVENWGKRNQKYREVIACVMCGKELEGSEGLEKSGGG